jgi:outer membrane biosynthesis protein TonB
MVSSSSSIDSAQWDQLGKSDYRVVAPKSDAWYNESDSAAEYHSIVRKAIFSKFQEFDFSSYAGKADIVKIDFELFADGSPKEGPKFIGTEDEGLKDLLMKCFKGAAPFPPFPKDLKKLSQRFALSVSFKK